LGKLKLLSRINPRYVNQFGIAVERTGDAHILALVRLHMLWIIEQVDLP
jgi:hypothetical protein